MLKCNRKIAIIADNTHCGGVEATLIGVRPIPSLQQGEPFTVLQYLPLDFTYTEDRPIDQWLNPLTNLTISLDLSKAPVKEATESLLMEENVQARVLNMSQTWSVQQAWNDGKPVLIHECVHDIAIGRLRDLGVTLRPAGNDSLFSAKDDVPPGHNGWPRGVPEPLVADSLYIRDGIKSLSHK